MEPVCIVGKRLAKRTPVGGASGAWSGRSVHHRVVVKAPPTGLSSIRECFQGSVWSNALPESACQSVHGECHEKKENTETYLAEVRDTNLF